MPRRCKLPERHCRVSCHQSTTFARLKSIVAPLLLIFWKIFLSPHNTEARQERVLQQTVFVPKKMLLGGASQTAGFLFPYEKT